MTEDTLRSIGFILITILVSFIISAAKNEKYKNDNSVRLPKLYFYCGIFFTVLASVIFIGANFIEKGDIELWKNIMNIFFILLGLVIIIECINGTVKYDDEGFTYKTFFGRKCTYKYSDITNIKRTKNLIRIYAKSKCLYIDKDSIGLDEFFQMLIDKGV